MSLLEGIHTCRSELSPAEKRVADVVLDDPDRAMRLPMARLARRNGAGTSVSPLAAMRGPAKR
ncbi:MAG: hypothetical protein AAFN74_02415, partial [Myxococcota bacterium]